MTDPRREPWHLDKRQGRYLRSARRSVHGVCRNPRR